MRSFQIWFAIGIISFFLNLAWEFSHYSLYLDLSGIPQYPHLVLATFTDMLFILGIFAVISFFQEDLHWMRHPQLFDYLLVFFFGVIVAATIEFVNLSLGRWKYTDAMPTLFTLGLSPLFQLAVTGCITLSLVHFLSKTKLGGENCCPGIVV